MKVKEEFLSCPKCKKEYINYDIEGKVKIYVCPDCNISLVPTEDVECFNDEEYIGENNTIVEDDDFNIYIDVHTEVEKFLDYNKNGKVVLVPKIEKVHDSNYDIEESDYYYIVGYLYIIGYTNKNKECIIGKAKINSTYGGNDKYKKDFIKNDLEYILKYRSEQIYKSINQSIKKKVSLRRRLKK